MTAFSKILFATFLSIFLSACTGMPLLTAYKLRNLDPMETDPAMMSIAVVTDESITLSDSSAFLDLSFTAEDAALSLYGRYETSISEIQNPIAISYRIADLSENQRLTLFKLIDEDALAMRAMQQQIRKYREDDIQGRGSISVSVNSGCFDGTPPEVLPVDVYVRFSQEQGYLPLVSGLDVLEEALKADALDKWLQCAE